MNKYVSCFSVFLHFSELLLSRRLKMNVDFEIERDKIKKKSVHLFA